MFSNDKTQLQQARVAIEDYLGTLRLKIHPIKSQLFETKQGANFLGFRVLPKCIRVKSESLRRAKRRMKRLHSAYQHHQIPLTAVENSICSWIAHVSQGDTWQLRKKLLTQFFFVVK